MEQDSYRDIRGLYLIAEKKIKQIEVLEDELPIPPVNELRYVGHHICNAVTAKDTDEEASQLSSAKKHCRRAIYDALEIGITYFIRECDQFRSTYWFAEISGVIDGYSDDLATIAQIQNQLAERNRYKGEVDNNWKTCQEEFETLQHIYRKWDVSRNELNKKWSRWRIMFVIGIAGIILGVVTIILQLIP